MPGIIYALKFAKAHYVLKSTIRKQPLETAYYVSATIKPF